jgi:hypothetical protein
VCAALLDLGAPEETGGPAALPEHVQRWMSRDLAARDERPAPAAGDPPPPADAERFDPDALFREIGRPAPPAPPAPSAPPVPPAAPAPETAWAVDVPDGASGEDIERATARAMREERLRRRPGFLDRIFTDRGDEET